MLTAPPVVFTASETGDVHSMVVTVIFTIVAILVMISAGMCVLGPNLRDLWRFDPPDDEADDDDWWEGEEAHIVPASPMFVPGRQVRQ